MPTKEELLEAKVEVLEHNLATLIAMVTDLAAETHTIRDYIHYPDEDSFRMGKARHYQKILEHWKSFQKK